jgi:hypothetical protein
MQLVKRDIFLPSLLHRRFNVFRGASSINTFAKMRSAVAKPNLCTDRHLFPRDRRSLNGAEDLQHLPSYISCPLI